NVLVHKGNPRLGANEIIPPSRPWRTSILSATVCMVRRGNALQHVLGSLRFCRCRFWHSLTAWTEPTLTSGYRVTLPERHSTCCPSVGSLSAPTAGLTVADGLSKTTRISPQSRSVHHSRDDPADATSMQHKMSGRTLRAWGDRAS